MFLSLLRGVQGAVSKCQAMNRRALTEPKTMIGWPLSLQLCSQTTMRSGKIDTEVFLLSWQLSKETKPSQDQAMADPTTDLRQQLTDHEADKDKCFSNLGDCSGLSKEARRWNSRNQGSSQLTIWQWLTRARRAYLTNHEFKNRQKKEDSKIPATIQNFRRSRKGTGQSKHSQHFQATMMWAWLSI